MKKTLLSALIGMMVVSMSVPAHAGVEFSYTAGAEVVSAYLWRGQYNGGLSFQPELGIGFEGEKCSFEIGAWGSVGASDWAFKFGQATDPITGANPNTYFVPELDLMINFNIYGIIIGATHYFYCDGTPFFNFTNNDANTAQTEVTLGYNFTNTCEVPLTVTWNTMVAGNDFLYDSNGDQILNANGTPQRAWSTYIEAEYAQPLPFDMTMTFTVGVSPWKSNIYNKKSDADGDYANFAFNNLSIRLEKEWEMGVGTVSIFAQGMLNTCGINKTNNLIWKAGDEKLYLQKLNGLIGASVWF